jgi:hypothetical protein
MHSTRSLFKSGIFWLTTAMTVLVSWWVFAPQFPTALEESISRRDALARQAAYAYATRTSAAVAMGSEPADQRMAFGSSERGIVQRAKSGVIPFAELRGGDAKWVDTVVQLSDWHWLRSERLECVARHAENVQQQCSAEFQMALERIDERTGRIVYSRVEPWMSDLFRGTRSDDEACRPLLRCLARIRVGAELTIPAGDDDLVGIREKLTLRWPHRSFFNEASLDATIDAYSNHIEQVQGGADVAEDPRRYEAHKSLIRSRDYLRTYRDEIVSASEEAAGE